MKPTLYIISGGSGASGEQVVHTILAQFPEDSLRVVIIPHVRYTEQLDDTLRRAAQAGAIVVHTLVDSRLRQYLEEEAQKTGVVTFDLMGPLISQLTQTLGLQPKGEPGLYRRLNQTYYDRVAAIDFAMAHDDGRNPAEWAQADVVLVGVSRSGKTPLSLYLSVLGWKAANVPVVPGLELPGELFQLEKGRVIGMNIEPGQLLLLRQQRQRHLGAPGLSDYTNPRKIQEELEHARFLFRRSGFQVIDVTDKPIESIADEIIRLISARFGVTNR